MSHQPEREDTECRNCGTTFNLAAQHYYDDMCPDCMKEENPKRTWKGCSRCDEKIPPDELKWRVVRGGRRDPSTVKLPVHKKCKKDGDDSPRRRW
jgi:NMD protein affecting ribosome stability and mRNA decay